MKRLFSVLLILSLGVLLISGCQQSSSTPTETPSGDDVADMVGGMMSLANSVDAKAMGLMGIAGVSAADTKAMTASDLTYTNGWWTFSTTEGTVVYEFKARAYTALGVEITDQNQLSTANKLVIVATMTMGSSITYNFGTDSSPMTFDGIQTGTKSLNGTINMTVTDGQGNSYSVTLVYTGVTLDASGLPESGSVTFTFASDDYVALSATLAFLGNGTARLTFTAPDDLSGTAYIIDLLTGDVTPVST